jgi:hypothetical protein
MKIDSTLSHSTTGMAVQTVFRELRIEICELTTKFERSPSGLMQSLLSRGRTANESIQFQLDQTLVSAYA